MSKLDRIIQKGTNITQHYFLETNQKFAIYRYKQEVYAVRFEENEPVDYVFIWKSNKSKIKSVVPDYQEIGRGMEGRVYQKTNDKAMKVSRKIDSEMKASETNSRILEHKFFLKDYHIQDYFVLGLWNIKDVDNFIFYMPKEEAVLPTSEQVKISDFVMALKIINDHGYFHPDLANGPYHHNLQNLIETNEFVKALDIDSGFGFFQEKYADNQIYLNMFRKYRDQWIFVYNFKSPPYNENGEEVNWQKTIDIWYGKHEDQSLSDHPEVLIRLCHEGNLSLPQQLIFELNEELSRNLSENIKSKKTPRKFKNDKPYFSLEKQNAYQGLTDIITLKKVILQDLKNAISDISTIEELEEKKRDFFQSPEGEVIRSATGKTTKFFDLTTGSQKKAKSLFRAAEEQIQEENKEEEYVNAHSHSCETSS